MTPQREAQLYPAADRVAARGVPSSTAQVHDHFDTGEVTLDRLCTIDDTLDHECDYASGLRQRLRPGERPQQRRVLALMQAVAAMTDDQKVRLLTAFADLDDAVLARLHDASSVGWRSAVDIGGQRQVAWYLARHAAEHVAAVRGSPDYIGYKIGYVAAAVSHRDQLSDDQCQAITQPWQVAVGPL